MIRSLISAARGILGSIPLKPKRRRSARKRLCGEQLESRQLLTVMTWDGGGGASNNNWSNRFNWAGDVAPTAGDDLVFPGTSTTFVTNNDFPVNGTRLFRSMTLTGSASGSAYRVTGNPIQLSRDVTVNSVPGSFHEINTPIQFGTGAAHTVSVGDGTTLMLSRAISSATAINRTGTGRMILAGNNTFSGQFNAVAGITQLAHSNALGTTAGSTNVSPGAAIELQEFVGLGEEFPRTLTIAENISLGGHGVGNTGALRNVSGNNRWTGTVTLQAGVENSIGVDGSNGEFDADQLLVSGLVKDVAAAGFHKVGAGRLLLSGTNTYRSSTLIDQGTIRMLNSSALGSATGITRVQSGATLELDDVNLGGNETVSLNVGERLQLSGSGVSGLGALRNIEGDNTWSGGIELLSTSTISVDQAINVLTLASNITGATGSGLVKRGAGTLRLSGNNTYNGSTTISAGTLDVSGNTSAGTMIIANGTLQGTGFVGPTTLQANGKLSPGGTAIGTLSLKGLSARGGQILISTGQSSHDILNVNGAVNLGTAQIIVNGTTGLRGLSIINNDGQDAVSGSSGGTLVTSSSGQTYKVSYTGGTGNDVVLTRQNVAPMLTNRTVTSNVAEGQPVVLSATIVDPDALDQFFMTVDWGDGLVTNHQFKPSDPRNIALTHRYSDDGDYKIRMVWTDPSKAGNSGDLQTTVVNAAPVFEAGGSATARARSLFERTVRFTDQSSDAAFVTVDYGDGTAVQHLTPGKARSFVLQHRFSRVGSFTVNITIDDGDGGIVSDSFLVVVT